MLCGSYPLVEFCTFPHVNHKKKRSIGSLDVCKLTQTNRLKYVRTRDSVKEARPLRALVVNPTGYCLSSYTDRIAVLYRSIDSAITQAPI